MSLTVKVELASLAAGTYTGVLTISAEATAEQITVTAVVASGPVITAVQNSANGDPAIAPNSFVTIYGSGFAASPVSWNPLGSLPLTTGGVSVRINGKDAWVSYADPGQLNVLAPPDATSGPVTQHGSSRCLGTQLLWWRLRERSAPRQAGRQRWASTCSFTPMPWGQRVQSHRQASC